MNRIYVCRGSSCRKSKLTKDRLQQSLWADDVAIRVVGCQKICKGAVVGAKVKGKLQWFARMGSKKSLFALDELVRTGKLKKPLEKRQNKKRAGKLR